MNLIEQLGGYEKAKVILQAVGHEHDAMLLEYRRQHNIFEVGDKVVFKCKLESNDLFIVHSIDEQFIGVKRDSDSSVYYAYADWGLKHATDEEIKAGKRPEVNQ